MAATAETSMVEDVVEQILHAIARGIYAPGQRLIELDFTHRLAVSRGVVREAFQRLASDGVIEIAHNRGASVRRLDRREVDEAFAVRGALEVLAAECAAPVLFADPAPLLAIHREFTVAAAAAAFDRYVALNAKFHEAIADAGGNKLLAQNLRRLGNPLMLVQSRRALTAARAAESVAEHEAIVAAFRAGDLAALRHAVAGHVESSRQSVQALDDGFFD